jgi:hypothetical protein
MAPPTSGRRSSQAASRDISEHAEIWLREAVELFGKEAPVDDFDNVVKCAERFGDFVPSPPSGWTALSTPQLAYSRGSGHLRFPTTTMPHLRALEAFTLRLLRRTGQMRRMAIVATHAVRSGGGRSNCDCRLVVWWHSRQRAEFFFGLVSKEKMSFAGGGLSIVALRGLFRVCVCFAFAVAHFGADRQLFPAGCTEACVVLPNS